MELNEIIAQRLSPADFIKKAFEAEMIDKEILDYLIHINEFSGVMTLNSCAGHTVNEIEEWHMNSIKRPGAALYPYVQMWFGKVRLFSLFCEEAVRLDGKAKISLHVYPNGKSVIIEPNSDIGSIAISPSGIESIRVIEGEDLPEVRSAMFNQIIELLESITGKASFSDLRLKATAIKTLNDCDKEKAQEMLEKELEQ